MAENMMYPPRITNQGVFRGEPTHSNEVNMYGNQINGGTLAYGTIGTATDVRASKPKRIPALVERVQVIRKMVEGQRALLDAVLIRLGLPVARAGNTAPEGAEKLMPAGVVPDLDIQIQALLGEVGEVESLLRVLDELA